MTIYENTMAIDALLIMEEGKRPLTILPVVNNNSEIVGILRLHDLVKLGL